MGEYIIYCVGICTTGTNGLVNGGWGAFLQYGEHIKGMWGGADNVTRECMELLSSINSLEALKLKFARANLYTESTLILSIYDKWRKTSRNSPPPEEVHCNDLHARFWKLLGQREVFITDLTDTIENNRMYLATALARKAVNDPKGGSYTCTIREIGNLPPVGLELERPDEGVDPAGPEMITTKVHQQINEDNAQPSDKLQQGINWENIYCEKCGKRISYVFPDNSSNLCISCRKGQEKKNLPSSKLDQSSGRCPICNGTGKLERKLGPRTVHSTTVTCTNCMGTGYLSVDNNPEYFTN